MRPPKLLGALNFVLYFGLEVEDIINFAFKLLLDVCFRIQFYECFDISHRNGFLQTLLCEINGIYTALQKQFYGSVW